jgi:ubiquinone/menaquinone biosynthesis C-methylase UbiE
MEGEASHSARVGDLFDRKARRWAAKYDSEGSLADRLARFERTVTDKVPARGNLLDFGCGSGDLSAHLAALGYSVTGIDISSSMLQSATNRFEKTAQWIQLSPLWTRLPFEDATFDAVLASSVLEYVADLAVVFREVARVTKRGGLFASTVPDVDRPVRQFEAALRRLLKRGRWAMKAMPHGIQAYADYLDLSKNRFPADAWLTLGRLAGFEIAQTLREGPQPLLMLTFVRSYGSAAGSGRARSLNRFCPASA